MSTQPDWHTPDPDDQPPILSSWRQLYIIVLLLHAIIIALFYWFTHTFTV